MQLHVHACMSVRVRTGTCVKHTEASTFQTLEGAPCRCLPNLLSDERLQPRGPGVAVFAMAVFTALQHIPSYSSPQRPSMPP